MRQNGHGPVIGTRHSGALSTLTLISVRSIVQRKHFGSTRIRPPKQTVYTCGADSPGRLERLTPDRGIARGLALADDERALLSSEPVVSGGAALARRGTARRPVQ